AAPTSSGNINHFPSGDGQQPRFRVGWTTVTWPIGQCRGKRLRQGIFGLSHILRASREKGDELAVAATCNCFCGATYLRVAFTEVHARTWRQVTLDTRPDAPRQRRGLRSGIWPPRRARDRDRVRRSYNNRPAALSRPRKAHPAPAPCRLRSARSSSRAWLQTVPACENACLLKRFRVPSVCRRPPFLLGLRQLGPIAFSHI